MPDRPTLLRASPRKSDIDRAIKAMKDAGQAILGIEVYPDGHFRILTGKDTEQQGDGLEAWRAKRDARKALQG